MRVVKPLFWNLGLTTFMEILQTPSATMEQQEILLNLALGVVSGLVTSVIVLVFVAYWSSVVVPFWRELLYKGVRLDRHKWQILLPNRTLDAEATMDAEATIKQVGLKVTGIIAWHANDTIVTSSLEGQFCDLILSATYERLGVPSMDRGTLTLMSKHDNQVLQGKYAWYDESKNEIISGDYEWRKK
jgi:hypothetical protein